MPITTSTSTTDAGTGSILEIVLDRPKANTIDAATSRELSEIFSAFNSDSTHRVAIFTGAGERFFSAGWDLNAAAEGEAFDSDYGVGGFGGFPELPSRNKPIIAAINGMAVGGGFEIAMAADFIVAADHAQFFLPETRVGVLPDAGAVRLPRQALERFLRSFSTAQKQIPSMQQQVVNSAKFFRLSILTQYIELLFLPQQAKNFSLQDGT